MKHKQASNWIITAAILGGMAVLLGAFGAHTLKSSINEYQIGIFRTGVSYQFYHALAIGMIAVLSLNLHSKFLKYAFYCFLIGTLCFSGSLYLIATNELLGIFNWLKFLGPITPIGGVLFLVGWISIIIHGIHLRKHNKN
jgi:uncharacterized membrane protein YgdD (TMEM256/DUF423 family)